MNVSPATKAAAISDYLAGKGGYFQIALEYGISPYTFKKWVESPEKALNQASQKGIIELQSSKNECTGLIKRNDLEIKEPEFRTKDVEIKYLYLHLSMPLLKAPKGRGGHDTYHKKA